MIQKLCSLDMYDDTLGLCALVIIIPPKLVSVHSALFYMPLIIGSRIKVSVDKRIEGDEETVQKIGRETGTYKDHLKHAIHIKCKEICEKSNIQWAQKPLQCLRVVG